MLEVKISNQLDLKDQRTLCYVQNEDQLEALVNEMASAFERPMVDQFDETRQCWVITANGKQIFIDGYEIK